jgi:hypothetical protein
LRALRLQIVQDPGELSDLLVVEIEPMREKPERTPDPKGSASEVTVVEAAAPTSKMSACPGRRATVMVPVPARTARMGFLRTTRSMITAAARAMTSARAPPIRKTRMHFLFSFSPGHSLPAGFPKRAGMIASRAIQTEPGGAFVNRALHDVTNDKGRGLQTSGFGPQTKGTSLNLGQKPEA